MRCSLSSEFFGTATNAYADPLLFDLSLPFLLPQCVQAISVAKKMRTGYLLTDVDASLELLQRCPPPAELVRCLCSLLRGVRVDS